MIVSANLVGASDPFVVGVLRALGEHNVLWYREHAGQPSVQQAGVRYRPDAVGSGIALLDAPRLLQPPRIGSCGSLAAAMFGYMVANPWASSGPVELVAERRGPGVWHAWVKHGGEVWDPARRLRRG